MRTVSRSMAWIMLIAGLGLLSVAMLSAVPMHSTAMAQSIYQNYSDPSYGARSRTERRIRRETTGERIACTTLGCYPIPRNCHIELQKYWDGTTTGYDAIVCP